MNDVAEITVGQAVDRVMADRLAQAALRRLLRVTTSEQAVGELVGLVHALGGWTVPAQAQADGVLPVDLSMGVLAEPLLPAAEPASDAWLHLRTHLPGLVEDVRAIIVRLDLADRTRREAAVDTLTGLVNRRGLARVLAHRQNGVVVVMIDLDNFKVLNDTHGHQAGDDVLAAFAATLRASVRDTDVACRMGGEEFLLHLSSASSAIACLLLDRVRGRWLLDRPLPVTFSAGVAEVGAGSVQDAMAAADAAMYQAKDAGRDRVCVANEESA